MQLHRAWIIIDIIFYFGNEYEKINSLNKQIGINNHNLSFHFIDIF
ncbi:hypothetical protein BGAFAR04_K0021 (plasmid) [Borreliella garinii Far04]|nr:hypothetical protein BGAFAR04_K0021 [Borreliella garinii Far04]